MPALTHVILEVVCLLDTENDDLPAVCRRSEAGEAGIRCLLNKCPKAAFTDARYELAFSGANGEIDVSDESNWIGFGGDMEPEGISECTRSELIHLWEKIARKKIKEAYLEYLERIKDIYEIDRLINDIGERMRRQPHRIDIFEAHRFLISKWYRMDREKGDHLCYVNGNGGVIIVKSEAFCLKPVCVNDILKAVCLNDILSRRPAPNEK